MIFLFHPKLNLPSSHVELDPAFKLIHDAASAHLPKLIQASTTTLPCSSYCALTSSYMCMHLHTSFPRLAHLLCASSYRKPSRPDSTSDPSNYVLASAMHYQSTLDYSLYCNCHTHCEVPVTKWNELNCSFWKMNFLKSELRDALRNSPKKHTVVCYVKMLLRMLLIIFLEPSSCFFLLFNLANSCTSPNRIVFSLDTFSIVWELCNSCYIGC